MTDLPVSLQAPFLSMFSPAAETAKARIAWSTHMTAMHGAPLLLECNHLIVGSLASTFGGKQPTQHSYKNACTGICLREKL
jgi:hypothetical protein